MNQIVCKFGGTSVATKENIELIADILSQNNQRKFVVLSAPGRTAGDNTKVTDHLINISNNSLANKDVTVEVNAVKTRYKEIYQPLGLDPRLISDLCSNLDKRISVNKINTALYRDSIVALGEEINSRLFSEYLNLKKIKAQYVSPKQAGLIVTSVFGDAQPLEETSSNLSRLKEICPEAIVVFPGFFGVTRQNEVATFSRGGSDLTGALLAEAINAYEYENWTDVDGIFSANPEFVPSPEQIPALTYKEMRELSYMGFNVLHEEAVKPVIRKKIPIRLRNTNNLENKGTLIVARRLPSERDLIGIASGKRFCSFNLEKFLMNREVGFIRKLLSIFEELNLPVDHCPTGVDNISILLNQNQLGQETVHYIVRAIEDNLSPDDLKVEFGIALISVVGEGLLNKIGVLAQAASALAKANINVKLINQDSSKISIIFGIDAADEKKAVAVLYNEFFNNKTPDKQ